MIPIIIQNIEDDDDRAFMEEVYESFNRHMYSVIYKITKDSWITEDVMQTAIVKLIEKVRLLRSLTKPKLINYISTTARNTALTYIRDNSKIAQVAYIDELKKIDYSLLLAEETSLENDMLEKIHAGWRELDERNRRLLELKYILATPDDEIAIELGISKDSVRMSLTRARNRLKKLIADIELD